MDDLLTPENIRDTVRQYPGRIAGFVKSLHANKDPREPDLLFELASYLGDEDTDDKLGQTWDAFFDSGLQDVLLDIAMEQDFYKLPEEEEDEDEIDDRLEASSSDCNIQMPCTDAIVAVYGSFAWSTHNHSRRIIRHRATITPACSLSGSYAKEDTEVMACHMGQERNFGERDTRLDG